jgi:hypothetical protein
MCRMRPAGSRANPIILLQWTGRIIIGSILQFRALLKTRHGAKGNIDSRELSKTPTQGNPSITTHCLVGAPLPRLTCPNSLPPRDLLMLTGPPVCESRAFQDSRERHGFAAPARGLYGDDRRVSRSWCRSPWPSQHPSALSTIMPRSNSANTPII